MFTVNKTNPGRTTVSVIGILAAGLLSAGCAADAGSDLEGNTVDVAEATQELVKPYWVSNPTGQCASALRLTADGVGLTSVAPSGGGLVWDQLTSGGASTLSDTWNLRGLYADKDYNYPTDCVDMGTIRVDVTGTSVNRLRYYFTDCGYCDHD